MHTRIKVCGLTRERDVHAAAAAGADAVGFVCYSASPRHVPVDRVRALARELDVFVTPVLLFVNADTEDVDRYLAAVPNALLQFHGEERERDCTRYGRPYLRAVRVGTDVDLLACEREFGSAAALVADAPSDVFGGSGRAFDWSLVPPGRSKPLVLAGGLNADNVGVAINAVRPYAVDVSSGVEEAPGIKSASSIQRFIAAVRGADGSIDEAPVRLRQAG